MRNRQGGGYENCEVKINGELRERLARALAAMNWPRTARMSTAKVFRLLVDPKRPATGNGDAQDNDGV